MFSKKKIKSLKNTFNAILYIYKFWKQVVVKNIAQGYIHMQKNKEEQGNDNHLWAVEEAVHRSVSNTLVQMGNQFGDMF